MTTRHASALLLALTLPAAACPPQPQRLDPAILQVVGSGGSAAEAWADGLAQLATRLQAEISVSLSHSEQLAAGQVQQQAQRHQRLQSSARLSGVIPLAEAACDGRVYQLLAFDQRPLASRIAALLPRPVNLRGPLPLRQSPLLAPYLAAGGPPRDVHLTSAGDGWLLQVGSGTTRVSRDEIDLLLHWPAAAAPLQFSLNGATALRVGEGMPVTLRWQAAGPGYLSLISLFGDGQVQPLLLNQWLESDWQQQAIASRYPDHPGAEQLVALWSASPLPFITIGQLWPVASSEPLAELVALAGHPAIQALASTTLTVVALP